MPALPDAWSLDSPQAVGFILTFILHLDGGSSQVANLHTSSSAEDMERSWCYWRRMQSWGNCTTAARHWSSLVLLQRFGVILCLSWDGLNHLGQGSSVSFSQLSLQRLLLLYEWSSTWYSSTRSLLENIRRICQLYLLSNCTPWPTEYGKV